MRFTITFDGDSFDAKVIASENLVAEDIREFLQALLDHPSWRPGMSLLLDATEVTVREAAAEDIRRIAELFAQADSRIGPGAWAIVTGSPAAYGFGRMWQTLLEPRTSLRSHIFASIDEARGWLREQASSDPR